GPGLSRHGLTRRLVSVIGDDYAGERLVAGVHLINIDDYSGYRIVEYPLFILDGDAFLRDIRKGGAEGVAALAQEEAVVQKPCEEDREPEHGNGHEKIHQVDTACL